MYCFPLGISHIAATKVFDSFSKLICQGNGVAWRFVHSRGGVKNHMHHLGVSLASVEQSEGYTFFNIIKKPVGLQGLKVLEKPDRTSQELNGIQLIVPLCKHVWKVKVKVLRNRLHLHAISLSMLRGYLVITKLILQNQWLLSHDARLTELWIVSFWKSFHYKGISSVYIRQLDYRQEYCTSENVSAVKNPYVDTSYNWSCNRSNSEKFVLMPRTHHLVNSARIVLEYQRSLDSPAFRSSMFLTIICSSTMTIMSIHLQSVQHLFRRLYRAAPWVNLYRNEAKLSV